MAGHPHHLDAGRHRAQAHRQDGLDEEQRRLGDLGGPQPLLVAREGAAEVDARTGGDIEQLGGGSHLEEVGAHARGLAALTGEDQRDPGHSVTITSRPWYVPQFRQT